MSEAGGRLGRALHAEWTKLRTDRGTGGLLLAVIGLTVSLSTAVVAAVTAEPCSPGGCPLDGPRLSLTGVILGQTAVVILAVLTIGNEYSTGLIRTTLTAMPHRLCVLTAKAAVLSGVLLVTGTAVVLGSLLAGRLILPGHGFTAANGYPALTLADEAVLRAAIGSVLYLVLIGLLSLGIATAVRDSATASGLVLGLLYLFPLLVQVVKDPQWQRHLQQLGPMNAGLAIQNTIGLDRLPIGPWAGLAVLAGWASAALLAGGLVLSRRDA